MCVRKWKFSMLVSLPFAKEKIQACYTRAEVVASAAGYVMFALGCTHDLMPVYTGTGSYIWLLYIHISGRVAWGWIERKRIRRGNAFQFSAAPLTSNESTSKQSNHIINEIACSIQRQRAAEYNTVLCALKRCTARERSSIWLRSWPVQLYVVVNFHQSVPLSCFETVWRVSSCKTIRLISLVLLVVCV